VQSAGIRAIVTGRAKNPLRLETKVRQRSRRSSYETVDDIYKDIVDLASARVALYFPGDRDVVEKLIRANFDAPDPPKRFPEAKEPTYKKRFSGYWATHYRVR
jgi:ppGpp synthetase/RelA/SpoT-type nucleotidyltranferase